MLRAVAVVAVTMVLAGCGGSPRQVAAPGPLPIGRQDRVSASSPRVTAVALKRPIKAYKTYVARQLGAMAKDLRLLRRAVAEGSGEEARAAWRQANTRYQTIGAAYGAFGNYDKAINAGVAGLAEGVHDRHFTGLQRVELALFGRRSLADAERPVVALQRAVARLRSALGKLAIDPLEYVIRAHEILEDTLGRVLTGNSFVWSAGAYDVVGANIRGARFVLGTLTPLLRIRRPTVATRGRRELDDVDAALASARGPSGAFPRPAAAGQLTRERIAQRVAAAAEELSAIPEALDPRPPRPARPAFGTAG